MTTAEVQAILTTIHGHIDGKAGDIEMVVIKHGGARVELSWEAFVANFAGTASTSTQADGTATRWVKQVGNIVYRSLQPSPDPAPLTVPDS